MTFETAFASARTSTSIPLIVAPSGIVIPEKVLASMYVESSNASIVSLAVVSSLVRISLANIHPAPFA